MIRAFADAGDGRRGVNARAGGVEVLREEVEETLWVEMGLVGADQCAMSSPRHLLRFEMRRNARRTQQLVLSDDGRLVRVVDGIGDRRSRFPAAVAQLAGEGADPVESPLVGAQVGGGGLGVVDVGDAFAV